LNLQIYVLKGLGKLIGSLNFVKQMW